MGALESNKEMVREDQTEKASNEIIKHSLGGDVNLPFDMMNIFLIY